MRMNLNVKSCISEAGPSRAGSIGIVPHRASLLLASALILVVTCWLPTLAKAQSSCSLTQISDTTAGINFNASIDVDGSCVAFSSTGEPVAGGNADGNSEIFLWLEGSGVSQITNTTTPENLTPERLTRKR